MSPRLADETLKRLRLGYTDKSGSRYSAATRMPNNCLLAQKGKNRDNDTGYIQIAPISTNTRGLAGSKNDNLQSQNAHRLVVMALKSEEDRCNLIEKGWEASHLCHNPTCIEETHIVVEAKKDNEARKVCKGKFTAGYILINGIRTLVFKSDHVCHHSPSCLRREFDGRVELSSDDLRIVANEIENA